MRKRILVTDDNEQCRRTLVTILNEAGYSVDEAENGTQALSRVETSGWQFDLLITDLYMPDMDGLQLLIEIKRIDPQLPVIAISGSFSGRLLGFAATFGVATLEKPFRRAPLLNLVESVLAATSPLP
jgi:two-component system chemotaxis response regulator CheY